MQLLVIFASTLVLSLQLAGCDSANSRVRAGEEHLREAEWSEALLDFQRAQEIGGAEFTDQIEAGLHRSRAEIAWSEANRFFNLARFEDARLQFEIYRTLVRWLPQAKSLEEESRFAFFVRWIDARAIPNSASNSRVMEQFMRDVATLSSEDPLRNYIEDILCERWRFLPAVQDCLDTPEIILADETLNEARTRLNETSAACEAASVLVSGCTPLAREDVTNRPSFYALRTSIAEAEANLRSEVAAAEIAQAAAEAARVEELRPAANNVVARAQRIGRRCGPITQRQRRQMAALVYGSRREQQSAMVASDRTSRELEDLWSEINELVTQVNESDWPVQLKRETVSEITAIRNQECYH